MDEIKLNEDVHSTVKKLLIGHEKVPTMKILGEKVGKESTNLSRQLKNPSYRLLLQVVNALGYDLILKKQINSNESNQT